MILLLNWRIRKRGTKDQRGQRFPVATPIQKKREYLWKNTSLTLEVPKGVKVRVLAKPHNPIELKDLRDPHSDAPLEPASEYGSSIMYSPYTGSYVMVKTPNGNAVKPRFTAVDEGSLKIAKSYLKQASNILQADSSLEGLKQASRLIDDSQRVEPWQDYHGAGLEKNPVYVELKQLWNYVASHLQSAIETPGKDRQKFIEQARNRVLTAAEAIAS